jgi:hypothetical protein
MQNFALLKKQQPSKISLYQKIDSTVGKVIGSDRYSPHNNKTIIAY